ncbi:hypothetical protein O4H53_11035 [Sulfitobacter sp. G21635-S1]|nr:hypothetical protein [Sulfitobacter sp. G21635-S1]
MSQSNSIKDIQGLWTFIVDHPFQSKIAQFQARERRNNQLFQALFAQKWAILAKPLRGAADFASALPDVRFQ